MDRLLFPADQRGKKDIGWLKSNFSFSFSDYFNPTKSAFGTLVAFNDDSVETGKGFGIHPHQNMEIISILLKGKMNHKDSMGYSSTIEEGGVQIMSAGEGLFHEEYNIGHEEANFLQIWIQPKLQNVKPRYQQRHFPRTTRVNCLKTVVSNEEGIDHCWVNQNAKISLGYYEQDTTLTYRLNPLNRCLFVFCITGTLNIDGQPIYQRDALGVWNTESIELHIHKNSEFAIIETVINQK